PGAQVGGGVGDVERERPARRHPEQQLRQRGDQPLPDPRGSTGGAGGGEPQVGGGGDEDERVDQQRRQPGVLRRDPAGVLGERADGLKRQEERRGGDADDDAGYG